MKKVFIAILFLTLRLFAQTRPAANTFEVYPLGSSDAGAMQQTVLAIAGPDGTVTVDEKNRRLLVLATPDQHAKIAELFSKTAVVPMNVRIEVSFSSGEMVDEKAVGVSGAGAVEIEEGITHVQWKIRPQIKDGRFETSNESRQMLLVASGREAMLRVGESVPFQTWLVDYGVAHGCIPRQTEWRDAVSAFVVEPTVIGDGPMIRIRVTPELTGVVNGSPRETRFAAASTEVVVNDGESVLIGTESKESEFYSKFLVGSVRGTGARQLTITLKPHIYFLPEAKKMRPMARVQNLQDSFLQPAKTPGETGQLHAGSP